jgi:hypothetical protein
MTGEQREAIRRAIDAEQRRKLSRTGREIIVEASLRFEDPSCAAYGRWSNERCRNRPNLGSAYCGWHRAAERLTAPPAREARPELLDAVMDDVEAVLGSTDLIGPERSEGPLHSTEQTLPGAVDGWSPNGRPGAASCVHAADTSCKSLLFAPSHRLTLAQPAGGIQGSTTVEAESDDTEAAS